MKSLPLSLIFSGALLSGCAEMDYIRSYADHPPQRTAYNDHVNDAGYSYSIIDGWKYRLTSAEVMARRPAPSIRDNVRVVEFQNASRQIQDACTQEITAPIMKQGGSFGGEARATVIYDIDETGRIINPEIDKAVSTETVDIGIQALRGVAGTRFNPPQLNGQPLYCRNVRDSLDWFSPGWNKRSAVRSRSNSTRSLEW